MMTTEVLEPNFEDDKVQTALPNGVKSGHKVFKHFVHIIPDRQHQFFKLVDRI
jgi:hypothetical protein